MSYIVDAHSHLADVRMDSEQDLKREQIISRARAAGIGKLVQGGVGPEDWVKQILLSKKYPEIATCFGLHPYWVADHSSEDCESALDELAKVIKQAVALGEAGLDLRPHICKDSLERQITVFEKQIELARVAGKPIVLHLVRAHEEALRIFLMWGIGPKGGMVHSFNGSQRQAEDYLNLGLYLSVGGPLCRPDNKRLHQALSIIPLDKLLLETDSPDQPPPGIADGQNEPFTLLQVADSIATILQITRDEVLDRASVNAQKLFSL